MEDFVRRTPKVAFNSEVPPPYSDFMEASSAARTSVRAPTYSTANPKFHEESVPETIILTPMQIPEWQPSAANFEKDPYNGTIISTDPLLSTTEEVWKFFLTHLNPPQVILMFKGVELTEFRRKTVFKLEIDISNLLQKQWRSIMIRKGQEQHTINTLLTEYCECKRSMKQIVFEKRVGKDVKELVKTILHVIHVAGFSKYNQEVEHDIIFKETEIKVETNTKWHAFLQDKRVKIVSWVTFLWLIRLPILKFYKKRLVRKLTAEFCLSRSIERLYQEYYRIIIQAVQRKEKIQIKA